MGYAQFVMAKKKGGGVIPQCTLDTTPYSKCDQASDLWHQLELPSELESDLRDTGLGQEVAC